jgi:ENTS family enterobactin (siderophore) exporter
VTDFARAGPPTAVEALARNRDLRVFVVGQGISGLGDAVSLTALPLLVLALTGSGVALGVVGALGTLPDLAVALFAGALADRADRKRMMLVADLGRAVLTALIPLSVALGGPTMAVILVVAAPLSVLRAVFRAGYISSLPGLVGRPQLARANALLETVYSVAFIVGPTVAGVLAAGLGPGPTIAIDAVSYVVSSAGLFLVSRDLRPPPDRVPSPLIAEVREGIVHIAHDPLLRAAILVFATFSAAIASVVSGLAFRITHELGQPPTALGAVMTAWGVGAVVGSLAAGRVGRETPVARVLLGSLVVAAIALVGVALVESVAAMAVLAALFGAAESVTTVTYISVRAAYSPDRLLGRIAGTARVIALALQPIGMLAGGALLDAVGGSATFGLMGAAVGLVVLVFAPVRTLRDAPISPGRWPSEAAG